MKKPVIDKDLTQLLRHCDNNDLEHIVSMLLAIPSQTLTIQPEYREHQGDHKRYVDEIVYEITSLGGNSLANLVRGQGIPYADMVRDVAGRLGIRPAPTDTVPTLEEKILIRIITLAYDRLEEDDRLALRDLLSISDSDGQAAGEVRDPAGELSEEELGRRLAAAGTSLLGDRVQHAIAVAARSMQLRQAIRSIARAGIAKIATIGLGGPVSWTVAAGQALYGMFGPNYTAVIGLIAQIALLRQKYAQIQRDIVEESVEADLA